MSILQPLATDSLGSPSHSLQHRIMAVDALAPLESVVIGSDGGLWLRDAHAGALPTWFTKIKTGSQTADIAYNLPTAQGAAGTVLKNDGSGNLSWGSVSAGITVGSAIASGTNNRFLYQDSSGNLAESANAQFDGTTAQFTALIIQDTGGQLAQIVGTNVSQDAYIGIQSARTGSKRWGLQQGDSVLGNAFKIRDVTDNLDVMTFYSSGNIKIGSGQFWFYDSSNFIDSSGTGLLHIQSGYIDIQASHIGILSSSNVSWAVKMPVGVLIDNGSGYFSGAALQVEGDIWFNGNLNANGSTGFSGSGSYTSFTFASGICSSAS